MPRESVRCRAHSSRTGALCKSQAMKGGTVCRVHGGSAPQVKRKAEVRHQLAQLIQSSPRQHPWQVLLDALHIVDSVMRDAVHKLQNAEELTPEMVDRMVEATERTARIAKITLDARADERRGAYIGQQVELLARVVNAALDSVDLTDAQRMIAQKAMRAELERIDDEVPQVLDGAVYHAIAA